ncbi:S8 family peptidase [Halorussus gelatinilyticus]|uniref:S8 family peptidase n=1 Tax=Halorussus gelatinilyticus TaxID=2937524 RepID=A0A8U0IEQ6_9EURY|nr:S8 family peptidase [Halorussus gelatinilyticus]UPV98803.1 S8 family peptidase [Halorussus gelatinilyticus]
MSDNDDGVSRRNVLKIAGSSMATVGVAGLAGAKGQVEVNVGFASERGRRKALDAADETVREFDSLDIVTAKMPARAAKGLRKNPNIRYVEKNGTVHAHAQTLPWGIDRVDADVAHGNGDTGSGADIAILDTGIDSDHPDLQANLGAGKDFSGKGTWEDGDGHGTHCAGIANAVNNSEGVVGVSTEATLHAGKVLDDSGSGSFSDVAAGIEWAANQGYDVASLSLGASSGTTALKDAVDYAYNNGVLVVSSAGNSGPCTDCVGYPAAYGNAMAISSTDSDDSLSSFSSTGPEIELAAPGGSIYSTYTGGGYDTLSGTSMSCPHVSGAGAQLMATGMTNTEARSALKNAAEDIGLGSNESGAGLLDVEAALNGDTGGGGGGTGDTAPAVDSLSVTNNSNGGWARFEVSWSVSDADGDLASVEITLTKSTTVDSSSSSVGGSSASGSARLQEKRERHLRRDAHGHRLEGQHRESDDDRLGLTTVPNSVLFAVDRRARRQCNPFVVKFYSH